MTKTAERIFELLDNANLSDYAFCQLSGIPCSTLNDWRNRNKNPSSKSVEIVCRTLGITLSDFYNGGVFAGSNSSSEEREYKKMKVICKKLIKEHKAETVIPYMEYVLKENA